METEKRVNSSGVGRMFELQVFPLVPGIELPVPAPAVTRKEIPSGYGVREQCLPFTAANALGCQIRSPISFGICPPTSVPHDAHAFRSPLDVPCRDGTYSDSREFYVRDDPKTGFVGNAFTLSAAVGPGFNGKKSRAPLLEPGLSFFDRDDQLDLFKLHLPYIWKTPSEVDALFMPRINSQAGGLSVMCGLVETDWYANPVNLVLVKPPNQLAVHVSKGDPIAQVLFVSRSHRTPRIKIVEHHARAARDFRTKLSDWYAHRQKDRSAYKKLARSPHGRIAQSAHISPSNSTTSTSSS